MAPDKYCANCGNTTPADSLFCKTCGARIVQERSPKPAYAQSSLKSMKSETETESSVKSKFGDEVDRLFPVTTAKELEKSPFPAFRKKLRREPVELEPPPKPLTQNDIALILMQKKNPGVAAVLSFFWAGLGQIYNGQIAKGVALMIVQVINVLLLFVLIGFITYPLVWLIGIVDAYGTARKHNERLLKGEFS